MIWKELSLIEFACENSTPAGVCFANSTSHFHVSETIKKRHDEDLLAMSVFDFFGRIASAKQGLQVFAKSGATQRDAL